MASKHREFTLKILNHMLEQQLEKLKALPIDFDIQRLPEWEAPIVTAKRDTLAEFISEIRTMISVLEQETGCPKCGKTDIIETPPTIGGDEPRQHICANCNYSWKVKE